MTTPAQVIGENVKTRREHHMTAEEFGQRIGEYFGKPWPRQTVYMMEQGRRRLAAEEVVAIALILDVSIADLFTPPAEIDRVQVGSQRFPRERLLTQGEKDSEHLYEIARHTHALERSIRDIHQAVRAQRLVVANIELALLGKPPIGEPPPRSDLVRLPATPEDIQLERHDYERAQEWYEADASVPVTEAVEADQ